MAYDSASIMNYCSFIATYLKANPPKPRLSDGDIQSLKILATYQYESDTEDLAKSCKNAAGVFDSIEFCCHFKFGQQQTSGSYKICPPTNADAKDACESQSGRWDQLGACCWLDTPSVQSKLCADVFKSPIEFCKTDGGAYDKIKHCCDNPTNPTPRSLNQSTNAPSSLQRRGLGYEICSENQGAATTLYYVKEVASLNFSAIRPDGAMPLNITQESNGPSSVFESCR